MRTLDAIAGAAVEGSLQVAAERGAELEAVTNRTTREGLRRRFAAATAPQRQAAALVHLGGYGREDVADLLETDAAQIDRWCAPFEPPPGSSWSALGDPELSAPGGVTPGRSWLRRIPLFYWILGACVVVFGLWAATSVGKRPSIEPVPNADSSGIETGTPDPADNSTPTTLPGGATPTHDDTGTSFSVAAPTLPSAGCAAGDNAAAGVAASRPGG